MKIFLLYYQHIPFFTKIIAELRRPKGAKWSTIIIETESHMCIEIGTHATPFFMVNMGSGMHHGSVHPTTTTKNDDVAQHGGH